MDPVKNTDVLNPDTKSNQSLINNISFFVDANRSYISTTLYALSAVGMLKILHSVKFFTQFKSAASIPPEFIKANYKLFGRVHRLELRPMTRLRTIVPVCRVEHIPIARFPGSREKAGKGTATESSLLTVAAVGINIPQEMVAPTKAYLDKLDRVGSKTQLVLLETEPELDLVHARLLFRRWPNPFFSECLACRIVSEGFAKVEWPNEYPQEDDIEPGAVADYLYALKDAQKAARRDRKGIWSGLPREASWMSLWWRYFRRR